MMRKSALMFEAGIDHQARELADDALELIRERPIDDKTLVKPSREGWALWLALKWDDIFENPADAFRKWGELTVLQCNAFMEMDHYTEALKEDNKIVEPPPFDLDMARGENITFFSSTGYRKYLAAYRAVRVAEQAGLPPAQGGVSIASNMLKLAAEVLSPHEPELSIRLILRITTYDKDKTFDLILSRTRVASMPSEVIESLAGDMIGAIDFALSQIHSCQDDGYSASWWDRLRVFVEALSRFVIRVKSQMVADIFSKALDLYGNTDIARHQWMPDPIKHLLFRSWETLSDQQKTERIQDLLDAPIAGVHGFIVSELYYPDPGCLLDKVDMSIGRNDGDENRWEDIIRFLIQSIEQGDEARKRASIRMSWLINHKILTDEETRDVTDAFWGKDYVDKEYLPEGTRLYDWAFLTIPEPESGISEIRFRRKWLDVSTELAEIRENLFEIPCQVGIAIRGLQMKGNRFELSAKEREYLAKVVTAWSRLSVPVPVGHSVSGEPRLINEREDIDKAINGLKTLLFEIKLPQSDGEILYEKIQLLQSYGIRTMHLSAGLIHVLPSHADKIVQNMRMSLARILHECANLAGIRDICAVAGRDRFDRAGTGSFDAVFGL